MEIKYLQEIDEEKRGCYLKSLYFSLDIHTLLPLAIEMYKKYKDYMNEHPERRQEELQHLCSYSEKVSSLNSFLEFFYNWIAE